MKEIQEEKELLKRMELSTSNLYFEFIQQKHKRFEFAAIAERLACERKGEDLLLLSDALTKWHNKSKNEHQKKELLSLLQCIWRIDAYCVNIETIIQQSVAEHVTTERRNSELVSEKRKLEIELITTKKTLEDEIKSLKAEIEFINSNNK